MDDFIPCTGHSPCFSKAHGNELWVLLMEKAWAKVHGSYDRIVSGQAHLAMRDITGAPGFEYIISEHEDLFDKIKDADGKNFCMAAGCDAKNEAEKKILTDLGLVGEHSYGIIGAVVVNDAAGNEI